VHLTSLPVELSSIDRLLISGPVEVGLLYTLSDGLSDVDVTHVLEIFFVTCYRS